MRVVFDVKLKRPACVLIQSAYGCGEANSIISRIDPRLWLLAPTDDMEVFEISREDAVKMAADCNAYHDLEPVFGIREVTE